ncbi:hypothetical protein KVT40_002881 [Elsinoe batatas]|uniref:Ribosome quality control complex subunit 2 n=1 Tax=Elsinoe batatas TaxID=2601811 RepID=A0A8K0L779_9PEZI|nr:hypothetical protein KVT40_002881 [Elsinoe batatas]
MKQRFSSLDVKIIAHELAASLVSLRVSNIYDLSSRIFLIKFAKPEHREQLIVDSGYRCHLSNFARSTAAAPSAFVTRLRKSLRTRRCTNVKQVGTDRVIDITFSDGLYHLYLEFYAGGNIILTDNESTILALLRTVSEGAEHEQFRVGAKYILSLRQNYAGVPELTKDRVRNGIQKFLDKAQEQEGQKKKFKRKPGDELRRSLATSITEYPPVLLEHGLHIVAFKKETPVADVLADDGLLDHLMKALDEARKTVEDITSHSTAKGYILAKSDRNSQSQEEANQGRENTKLMYDDFHPFKPAQFEDKSDLTVLEFEGFNKTVDEFFSSIEGQKLESRLQEREDAAKRKLQNARDEHERRIGGLQQVQELNITKAQAIEANVDRVEEARAAVNGLIAQGMDWEDIGQLIEMEQSRQNAVALTIKLPLKLQENTATLLLAGYGVDEDDDEEMADESASEASNSEDESKQPTKAPADKRLAVDIDLSQSAWANSRLYYENRKIAASKQDRTLQASTKALKNTEQKITADLKKGLKQEKQTLRPVRKQFWFEKFNWFISSDGYLVLCGKDAQQNELLYRRHLKKGDIYVHADLHGAASVVIKNNPSTPDAPIPPSTLSQAGNLSVCTSSAWDSKAVMSAYWVNADQVSKTAPSGEYLTTGGFMVRGKKNFLPPAQLLLGFAVLFQISEESKARHKKHRVEEPAPVSNGQSDKVAVEDEDMDDDDFPDAGLGSSGKSNPVQGKIDSDDDDDFPDAKADESEDELPNASDTKAVGTDGSADEANDDDSDEGEADRKPRSNPLQLGGSAPSHDDIQEDGEDESVVREEGLMDNDDATNEDQQQDTGIKHLSAAARRQLKKGTPNAESSGGSRLDTPSSGTNKSAVNAKPNQPTRGKRSKAKKLATKYADQDEEDRELAMALLGSRKPNADTAEVVEDTSKETAEEARARRREQHIKAQKAGLEAEEIRRLNLDEGVPDAEEGDEQTGSLAGILDGLVGTPLPGDEILEAIPISAPWAALGKFKYKAKMQPGGQKKGKAIREVVGKWVKDASEPRKVDTKSEDIERIWPREAELVKAWKEAEIVGVVPVKTVRVMMAGGNEGAKGGKGGKGKGGGRGGRGSKKK